MFFVQIENLNARLSDKKIKLALTETSRSWFAKNGYSPEYGARPLKRLIQNKIQDKIADGILAGQIKEGSSLVVEVNGDEMNISKSAQRQKMH